MALILLSGDQILYRISPSFHGGAHLELRLVRGGQFAQLDYDPQHRRWVLVPRWYARALLSADGWAPWPPAELCAAQAEAAP